MAALAEQFIAALLELCRHRRAKPVGSRVSEMRIDYGPGYLVYFTQRGPIVIVILCGGDKRTQAADIKQAIDIAAKWSE